MHAIKMYLTGLKHDEANKHIAKAVERKKENKFLFSIDDTTHQLQLIMTSSFNQY